MDTFKTWLVEKYIAHRGLHDNKSPENSLIAFKNAIDKGYAIELDIQQISDGTIVVFHDATLSRMTGLDGYVKNLSKSDLENIFLNKTQEKIPTFEEVLSLVDSKTPILIEIKNISKIGEFESAIYELLKKYEGEYAIQSFNPYVLSWFKENAPEVARGQISSYFKNEKLSVFKKTVLKKMLLNKVSSPHFISYEAARLPNRFVRKYNNLPILAWTVKSQKEYIDVIKYCDNIIFEGFIPKI